MTNYIQAGDILNLTAPSGGFTSGTPALVGGMLVVPTKTGASGATVACCVVGVFSLAKTSGEAWTEGQRLYWNPSTSSLTTTRLGRAVASAAAAAGSSATTGYARLDPSAATALDDHDVTVNDDDSAASNGVAVYLNVADPIPVLQFVSPTDTSGFFLTDSGDPVVVEDNDGAASDGVALYFDEDAAEDSRLQFVSPYAVDCYLQTQGGRRIRVKHDASAASNGVQVYFDEDGSSNVKVLFVSPTDTDGTAKARGGI